MGIYQQNREVIGDNPGLILPDMKKIWRRRKSK